MKLLFYFRLLYKQRIFCYVIEPLISKYNTLPEPVKENYLISILYQMDGNTYVTLAPYFSKVIFNSILFYFFVNLL